MSDNTSIEWTRRPGTKGATWNITTGCDKISPGCGLPRFPGDKPGGCYAMAMAKRLKGMGSAKYQTDGDPRTSGPGFGVTIHPDTLTAPLKWREPRTVFVNSMSDLFHADIPDDYIAQVWAVMAATPQHTYQVLTKRHGRMRALLSNERFEESVATYLEDMHFNGGDMGGFDAQTGWWPLPNVWLGVSVENQKWADIRIPALLDTPAAIRFLSCEPLLGPVDLDEPRCQHHDRDEIVIDADTGQEWCGECFADGSSGELSYGHWLDPLNGGINWVIVGGESGPGARPMEMAWPRILRDQCAAAGVPFFFKQTGSLLAREFGIPGKGHDWDLLPPEFQVREYPQAAANV